MDLSMKKLNYKIIIVLLLFPVFAYGVTCFYNYFLSEEDYTLEKKAQNTYAISIPNENFYSSNKWNCFPISHIKITTTKVDYDGWHEVPSIDARDGKKVISYDLDPDIRWDVKLVLDNWMFLAEKVESFCVFGVFMQKIDDQSDLWYIEQIKTEKGYWKRDDFIDYLSLEYKDYNNQALERWGVEERL